MADEYDIEAAGEEYGYETVGPYGYATGAAAQPRYIPAGQQRALPPGAAQRRFMPALTPRSLAPSIARTPAFMPVPGAAASNEARIRTIAREEISRLVPYNDVPPRPRPDEAMFPMGLGSATLTAAVPTVFLTAQPQRAFRGERLVLSVQRSAGATGAVVLLNEFEIGDYRQLVGGGALPVDVFASDAFGVRLMLDASTPGVLYRLTIAATVPAGESIIVAGAVIGRAGEAPQR